MQKEDQTMMEDARSGKRRTGSLLLAASVFMALIAVGAWQGDFRETLMNGTML